MHNPHGVRKMWHAMNRAGWDIGRDQTHRLMQIAGIAGAHRGRKPITTRAANAIDDRPDLVKRDGLHRRCPEPAVGRRFRLRQDVFRFLLYGFHY